MAFGAPVRAAESAKLAAMLAEPQKGVRACLLASRVGLWYHYAVRKCDLKNGAS